MTDPKLDPALLDPTRLAILALLAGTEWAEFAFVRDSVELSDSALSKRISALSDGGYVEVRKGYVGKRPRTWINLSTAGRVALSAHIAALQEIATRVVRPDSTSVPEQSS
ncbi:winged helix-turn-helix domain-containing protein [Micromonospora ureilytica]|uniref:DNA-binding transcriptional ArsR family regulator n=1 Tax=Micromonospora ureilytica TaxID=709868 RepID=A0ABS0JC33_9ACTN|nr:transcriptional regulator [Micromonospora ureilytica]MBG6064509.1 DNA-binding transcriptional ArsR family regulator [Micromonospora ureilytica]WSR55815.1 transcriptional regulator [Micromonospora ureilytica]